MKETRRKNLIIILLTLTALALFACGGVLFHCAIPRAISASAETADIAMDEIAPYDDTQPETCELSRNWRSNIGDYENLTEIAFLKVAPEGYTDSGKTSNTHIKIYTKNYDDTKIAFVFRGTITAPQDAMRLFASLTNLTAINFNNFSTSNATDMSYMFTACYQLKTLDLSGFDTSSVTSMIYMFYKCEQLTTLDLSGFDTSNVTDMHGMFSDCLQLATVNLSGFDTSNVTNMHYMFGSCKQLTALDLSDFDTSSVTDMGFLFYNCDCLKALDLSSFDTSNVTTMYGMFEYSEQLERIDLSGFDTSNVTDMGSMFSNCDSLTALDLSGFDTASVTNMDYTFSNCKSLTTLDLSSFNTSKVKSMMGLFHDSKQLTALDLSGFDTSNITDMNWMFRNCSSLTVLNLSSFDTSNVTNMRVMFYGCKSLELLDLSNFDITSVTNADDIFKDCTNLNKIITPKNIGEAELPLPCAYWNGTKDILSITSADADMVIYRHDEHRLGEWHEEVRSCTNMGTKKYADCEVCKKHIDPWGNEIIDLTIPPIGYHSFDDGKVTVPPTCTEDGTKIFTCTVCGATSSDAVEALGHTEVKDSTIAPTCTKDGRTGGKHCSTCGTVLEEQLTLPATGHTEVLEDAIAPTCTEDGRTGGKHCAACGMVLERQLTLPATGHAYGEWQVVTSPDGLGEERRVCANDETHFETRPLPKSTPDDIDEPPQSKLSAGAIAGISAGATVFLLFVGYVSCYFALYRKAESQGEFFHAIFAPMNAIFKKKGK